MQLRRPLTLTALGLGLAAAAAPPAAAFFSPEEQNAGALLRVFSDSDQVLVRSLVGGYTLVLPRNAAFDLQYNNERVTIPAIDAPVGSQEAVDAITTASRPITGNAGYEDYVKVRDEFTGVLRVMGASIEYYHSSESDYLGQMLGVSYARDFMNQQFTLSIGTSYGWDHIDPLEDDDTASSGDEKNTVHWNVVATQVLTPTTQMRVGVEVNQVEGLQHNPYRNVYAGGTNVPERHPDARERRDAFVKLSQYLPNRSSLRLHYRYYTDDWGIDSHELATGLSQYITGGIFARYEYRYYTQTPARFYREEYESTDGIGGYLTGDYRMADLSSHLLAASLSFDLATLAADHGLFRHFAVRFDYERYFNSNNYSANILETGLDFRF